MEDLDFRHSLLKRLDAVIHLLVGMSEEENKMSLTDKVHRLVDVGMSPAETAKMLGKPVNTITGILAKRKKGKTR